MRCLRSGETFGLSALPSFEDMKLCHCVRSYEARNIPFRLIVAYVRERIDLKMTATLAGVTASESVDVCRGGRQGGKGTPSSWNSMLALT